MFLKRNLSFLTLNLFFTIGFLIIAYPHIPLEGLAMRPFLVILFLSNAILLIIPTKLRNLVVFILLALSALYFGLQTVFYRGFNQYGLIKTALSVDKSMFKFADSALSMLVFSDVRFFAIPFVAFWLGVKTIKAQKIEDNFIHQLLMIVLLGTFSYVHILGFHRELNLSLNNPAKLQDLAVIYANIPNTNVFTSHFGLNGLIYREFDPKVTSIEIQPEVTLEQQITDILANNPKPVSSEMTGIFKEKNLLLIEAESLNNIAIDPVLTPTLYMLKTEGIFVEGYNSPLLAGSTSDTEFMVNTSLLPSNNGKITFNEYAEADFPHSLAKSFNALGYFSMASHNNYGIYYNRSVMLPNLGYTFYDAIGLEAYDNVEDSYVIDHIKWIQYEYEKYFSFWITFNAHQPYGKDTLNEDMLKYFDLVSERFPEMPEEEKVYFAKNMDLDRGLKELLIDYKNSEVLDDMVIIIYGDHFPKGLFSDKELYRHQCETNGVKFDHCFDTPLIIWNNQIEPLVVEKASSPLDIAPTIYDLFDVEYNHHLVLGRSVFDPTYDGFNFNEYGVIKTDSYVYDTLRDTVVLRNWTKSEETYRLEAEALYQRLLLGYKVVENNYFASREYRERFVSN